MFDVVELDLVQGAYLISPNIFEDERGSFTKTFEENDLKEMGIDFHITESFISVSEKGVLRGMHFQTYRPQKKIVYVSSGKIFDVIVDLRKDSPTFGQWQGIYLSSRKMNALYVPKGCAHGFYTIEDKSVVNYYCDGKYDKATDMGIMWNDGVINIKWPINGAVIVGNRDTKHISFAEFSANKEFIYE